MDITSCIPMAIEEMNNSGVQIPNDAETYMNLSYTEKFQVTLKLAMQEYITGITVLSVLKELEKPLIKNTYVLINANNDNVIGEYETEHSLKMNNNLSDKEYRYLKSYVCGNNKVKNPKYDVYYKYRIKTNTYKLKGNDYILIK